MKNTNHTPQTLKDQKDGESGAYLLMSLFFIAMLLATGGFFYDFVRIVKIQGVLQRGANAAVVAGIVARAEMGPGHETEIEDLSCRFLGGTLEAQIDDAQNTYNTWGFESRCKTAFELDDGNADDPPRVTVGFFGDGAGGGDLPVRFRFLNLIPWDLLGANKPNVIHQVKAHAQAQLNRSIVVLMLDFSKSMVCPASDACNPADPATCDCDCSFDNSCVSANSKLSRLRAAADRFLDRFTEEWDRIAVIPFNNRAYIAYDLGDTFNRANAKASYNNITQIGGDTNLAAALWLANRQFAEWDSVLAQYNRADRYAILFTDGSPNSATFSLVNGHTSAGDVLYQHRIVQQRQNIDNVTVPEFVFPSPLYRYFSQHQSSAALPAIHGSGYPGMGAEAIANPPTTGAIAFGKPQGLPPGFGYRSDLGRLFHASLGPSPTSASEADDFEDDALAIHNQYFLEGSNSHVTPGSAYVAARDWDQVDTTYISWGQPGGPTDYFMMSRVSQPMNMVWWWRFWYPGGYHSDSMGAVDIVPGQGGASLNDTTGDINNRSTLNYIRNADSGGLGGAQVVHSTGTLLYSGSREDTFPFNTNGWGTGNGIEIGRHFAELYFNAALAEAQALAQNGISLYVIGFGNPETRFTDPDPGVDRSLDYGALDPHYFSSVNGSTRVYLNNDPITFRHFSPYQLPVEPLVRDFKSRRDYFLAKLANDRLASDFHRNNPCHRGLTTCDSFAINFNASPGTTGAFNGDISTWDSGWGNEVAAPNIARGQYYPIAEADEIDKIFSRIATQILMRTIN